MRGRRRITAVGLALLLSLPGCGAAEAPRGAPLDRCLATSTSLRALEPTCWPPPRDGGAPDGAP